MNDYIFLMHDDAPAAAKTGQDWEPYLANLRKTGRFSGGSAIGAGLCVSRTGPAAGITSSLSGYIRVQADNIEEAQKLLVGNPVYEAGGTVEIRELPQSG